MNRRKKVQKSVGADESSTGLERRKALLCEEEIQRERVINFCVVLPERSGVGPRIELLLAHFLNTGTSSDGVEEEEDEERKGTLVRWQRAVHPPVSRRTVGGNFRSLVRNRGLGGGVVCGKAGVQAPALTLSIRSLSLFHPLANTHTHTH